MLTKSYKNLYIYVFSLLMFFYFQNYAYQMALGWHYKINFAIYTVVLLVTLIFFKNRHRYFLASFLFLLFFSVRLSSQYSIEIAEKVFIPLEALGVYFFYGMMLLREKRIILDRYSIIYLFIIPFSFISILINKDMGNIHSGFTVLLSGIIPTLMIYQISMIELDSKEKIKTLINTLVIIFILCLLVGLAQFFIDYYSTHYYIRIPSIFYNPTIFPIALIVLWPLVFLIDIKHKNIYIGIILFMSLVVMILTQTRGAYIVVLFQIFLYLYFFNKQFIKIITILIILFSISIVVLYHNDLVFNRVVHFDINSINTSEYHRLIAIKAAIYMGIKNLIFGVGLSNFSIAFVDTPYFDLVREHLESAHNFFLNIFAEQGLIVAILWLIANLSIMFNIYKIKNDNYYLSKILFLSLLGSFLYMNLFYGEFFHLNNFVFHHIVLFTIVLSIGSSLNTILKKNEPKR